MEDNATSVQSRTIRSDTVDSMAAATAAVSATPLRSHHRTHDVLLQPEHRLQHLGVLVVHDLRLTTTQRLCVKDDKARDSGQHSRDATAAIMSCCNLNITDTRLKAPL